MGRRECRLPPPFFINHKNDMQERKRVANTIQQEPSLEAQERLIEIMNDTPRVVSFDGTKWEVKALKPGTQWLIAQEAITLCKNETKAFGDVIKEFASNVPSVVKVITLCLLNDRRRIFANKHNGEFSTEYYDTYETIMWDTKQSCWIALLVEFLSMLDVEVFFSTTASIQMLRQSVLERKKTMEEQKQLSQERNSGK